MRRKFLAMTAALLALGVKPLRAQSYPDRAIKIINPFPGGPTDAFARVIAAQLSVRLGQPVVVEARAGAGGMIGVSFSAKQPADGYTLLVTSSSTQVVQPVMRQLVPYDAEKDFIPLFSPGIGSTAIVVNPALKVTSLKELIDYAKARPGEVTFGSSGPGTALHLAGEIFAYEAGVKLLHVPYKAAAQALTDLLGGQINIMFDSLANSGSHLNSKKLVSLGLMGDQRSMAFPDIRTTTELGFPAMKFGNWLGVYALSGTPEPIVNRLLTALKSSVDAPELKALLEMSFTTRTPLFGSDFGQATRVQRQALARVVKQANIALIE
jgi:tripartite-type tricarboxylate transporter receptor subunit TctC